MEENFIGAFRRRLELEERGFSDVRGVMERKETGVIAETGCGFALLEVESGFRIRIGFVELTTSVSNVVVEVEGFLVLT